ncbi:MAG TPA: ATP-binding protein [Candidatus Saccharimonadales bacterium]|nr:ATP-binding protein [Candidatus Saccharimonadales bacterium]
MDYLQQLIRRAKLRLFVLILVENGILLGGWWLASRVLELSGPGLLGLILILAVAQTTFIATGFGKMVMQPLKALWQAILHLSPDNAAQVAAPDVESLHFGHDLVANLTAQLYQIVSISTQLAEREKAERGDLHRNFIAQNLPLPLLILDPSETIKYANEAAAQYIGIASNDMIGKNVYMVLDMSFPSEDTFDTWLKEVKGKKATASRSWERVRLNVRDNHPTRLFDLASYYNRDNSDKLETMIVLFDHTAQYSQDDQAISFIALSVHELRTPLTLLRGYIEVFEEEMADKVDPELRDFMFKMRANAQQLMAFVNNILNVARIENDQLEVRLQEEDWSSILKAALDNLSLRAGVRGIQLQYSVAPGLPTVGADRLSIMEVINNLVDNAIKYSAGSKVIKVNAALNKEGLVETTVEDFGQGIPTSILPNLFTKFYRDHRNRAQIGGTGLGLYLSKAIVDAHGGTLWVRSQEGHGSTFGFTLLPFSQISSDQKGGDNGEIVRGAHGWIKNHSLYRR